MDIVSNIAKDWIFHDDAVRSEIERWYQKLWKEPHFKINPSFEYKLYALMLSGEELFACTLHETRPTIHKPAECKPTALPVVMGGHRDPE